MTKVLVVGPVTSYGGYGAVARAALDGMLKLGIDVKFQEFADYKANYNLGPERLIEYTKRRIEYHPGWRPDYIINCMSMGFPKAQEGIKSMALTGWESDRLNPRTAESLHTQDVIGVWSSFNKPLYDNYHGNVKVMPIGIDTDVFKPQPIPHKGFRFIANGKWEYRKNFRNLVAAFSNAFGDNPDVSLTLKLTPFTANEQEIAKIVSDANKNNANVNLVFNDLMEQELAALYNQNDVYVHPSRSEGYGVPMLEAMSCGLPLITSAEGGHREFANDDVSLFVKGKTKYVIPHHSYPIKSKMFEPNVKDIEAKLRFAYNNQDEMRKMGDRARKRALEYEQSKMAQRILDAFEELEG